jgi:hypothetical protein
MSVSNANVWGTINKFRPRTGTRTKLMLIHKNDFSRTAYTQGRGVARPDACDTPVFSVASLHEADDKCP